MTKIFQKHKAVVLKEGRFLRFIRHEEYEYVERNNCTGIVIIVPVTDEGQVIFVEQYRLPVDSRVIEFPAGLVNDICGAKKETLSRAANRELLEETGYRAARLTKLLEGPVSGGSTSDQVTMFLAKGLKKTGKGGGDPTEMITIHEVPWRRAGQWLRAMERKGFLIEPKVYAGLYFLEKEFAK
jgi:ADP-ribose pyrophosphatase